MNQAEYEHDFFKSVQAMREKALKEGKTALSEVKESRPSPSPVRSRLHEETETVFRQIEIEAFPERDDPLARVLAGIIAEVYILPPGVTVRIEGEALPADTVREVFVGITHEHVSGVIARFRRADYRIRHIKSYLRTALYNAVFEFDFDCENVAAIAVPEKTGDRE